MKNRLQWLYDEYMSEKDNEEIHDPSHQEYMKNLAMEMFAIESLMTSDINKHIHLKYDHNKLNKALNSSNWKWAMYLLLEDEVKGTSKYLMLHDLAIKSNKLDWATHFKNIAKQETEHAALINQMYSALPYSHGTQEEQSLWNKEYAELIELHKQNVSKL